MKSKFKVLAFILAFGISVFTAGYLYLNSIVERTAVSENVDSVPYYSSVPENKTVLMNICGDKILLNLNFKEEILNIIFECNDSESYGYEIDYTINCDYEAVGYIVDEIGGIKLDNQRCVGVQIADMLEYSHKNETDKREIAKRIVDGVAEVGFTKENLLYLIENSETDLKFSDGLLWVSSVQKLCGFPRYVN